MHAVQQWWAASIPTDRCSLRAMSPPLMNDTAFKTTFEQTSSRLHRPTNRISLWGCGLDQTLDTMFDVLQGGPTHASSSLIQACFVRIDCRTRVKALHVHSVSLTFIRQHFSSA
jgi:hypothetical protein